MRINRPTFCTAGQCVLFRVYRDGANAADNNAGTVKLVKVKLEYYASAESDWG